MTPQITLYAAKICPYAHRAEIALAETGLPFKRVEIDLKNKPEWYPKVPAITYGGAEHPPEAPPLTQRSSPNPSSSAKARYFVEAVGSRFAPPWYASYGRGEPLDKLLDGIESLQALLPATSKFAVGDQYTIADIVATPFFARLEVALTNDFGAYAPGEGPKAWKTLTTEPRFARWLEYYKNLTARESFKKTFDEEAIKRAYVAPASRK
ncbi:hypothetical protein BD626DRAFT_572519 [Schizophyllum amplum]|uniref:GST N-terminal domain-containing protein n=1 Tax=Schizophyllum amplum TaxID=97359 RepID=A0A550C442_9AGAR|nr:hypothetical protein BD626DRAFT_572519 [Auriculariopsis ampla]